MGQAKYLLSLEGVSVNENSAFEDTEFLMEVCTRNFVTSRLVREKVITPRFCNERIDWLQVMEIREQIESDPSPSELEQLNEQNKARMLESEQKLNAHFSHRDWDNVRAQRVLFTPCR